MSMSETYIPVTVPVAIPWGQLLSCMMDKVEKMTMLDGSMFCAWDVVRLRKMADLIEKSLEKVERDNR